MWMWYRDRFRGISLGVAKSTGDMAGALLTKVSRPLLLAKAGQIPGAAHMLNMVVGAEQALTRELVGTCFAHITDGTLPLLANGTLASMSE